MRRPEDGQVIPMFQSRTYRNHIRRAEFSAYQVTVKETDLHVQTPGEYSREVRDSVLKHRGFLEAYIQDNPDFIHTLEPWPVTGPMPAMVAAMVKAARTMGVGPMAAVAGAVAAAVGRELLQATSQVIIENGGDVFLKTAAPATLAVFAGKSPLNLRVGLKIDATRRPKAVCTSSGTIGHSLSLGQADAVCVVADSGSLADAAATALGNRLRRPADIGPVLDGIRGLPGIDGALAVMGETLGVCGQLEIVPVKAPGKS